MSEQKQAYIDKMVSLAENTNDLSLLDLICTLMKKTEVQHA